jgi:hypothetical protein
MNKDFLLDFIAGGVSAAVSKTVVAPLERNQSMNNLVSKFLNHFITVREENTIMPN